MEGMTPPCATPTATRAATMSPTLSALPGVSRQAADQHANDTIRVWRPPQRCAAHPPGICGHGQQQQQHTGCVEREETMCDVHCCCWLLLMMLVRVVVME